MIRILGALLACTLSALPASGSAVAADDGTVLVVIDDSNPIAFERGHAFVKRVRPIILDKLRQLGIEAVDLPALGKPTPSDEVPRLDGDDATLLALAENDKGIRVSRVAVVAFQMLAKQVSDSGVLFLEAVVEVRIFDVGSRSEVGARKTVQHDLEPLPESCGRTCVHEALMANAGKVATLAAAAISDALP